MLNINETGAATLRPRDDLGVLLLRSVLILSATLRPLSKYLILFMFLFGSEHFKPCPNLIANHFHGEQEHTGDPPL